MCCILHNMVLEFDGLYDIGTLSTDWETVTELEREDNTEYNTPLPSTEWLVADIQEHDPELA